MRAEGKSLKAEGKLVHTEGKSLKAEGKLVHTEGKIVEGERAGGKDRTLLHVVVK